MKRALPFVVVVPFLFSPFACTTNVDGNGGNGGGDTSESGSGLNAHCQLLADEKEAAQQAMEDDDFKNPDLTCDFLLATYDYEVDCCDPSRLDTNAQQLGFSSYEWTCDELISSLYWVTEAGGCID